MRAPDEMSWLRYERPVEIVAAHSASEVQAALAEVEAGVRERGLVAVGYLAYEAATGFDAALVTLEPATEPLLWFSLYVPSEVRDFADLGSALRGGRAAPAGKAPSGRGEDPNGDGARGSRDLSWKPTIGADAYTAALERIKEYIGCGDTYQVNFSYRLRAPLDEPPAEFFEELYAAQPSRYAAYIETEQWALASVSPELFFSTAAGAVEMRPMKGTIGRGRTLEEDRRKAAELYESEKDRAENLMIVDMMRNDIGRVARPGSVAVPELFALEKYPTLWQMTSRVTAESDASVSEILSAIFPCASITGAPKVRTMEIIAEFETTPRGIYTGAIGTIRPDGSALFSVAIRTAAIRKAEARVEYGVGGGIVWDSRPELELSESRLKAAVLGVSSPRFELLETLFWSAAEGYWLFHEHMDRLSSSAEYFSVPLNTRAVYDELHRAVAQAQSNRRVRLLVSQAGAVRVEAHPHARPGGGGRESTSSRDGKPWRLRLAASPIDRSDRFLYHKTTNRDCYRRARESVGQCDDVLLWNEEGWATESTLANLVVRQGDRLVTPPISCGLLPGTYRRRLLEDGTISEAAVHVDELGPESEIYLVNSLRGWIQAQL